MGQMNLGGQTPGQQQQQPGAPAPVVQEAYDPLSVNQSSQTNPLYMRMSINSVPDSGNLLNKSNLPFACVIHPIAEATNPDVSISHHQQIQFAITSNSSKHLFLIIIFQYEIRDI